jgi:hypothetical protein
MVRASMASDARGRRVRVDADGVRIEKLPGVRGRVWAIAVVLGLVGVALLLRARSGTDVTGGAAAPVAAGATASHAAQGAARPPVAQAPRRPAAPPQPPPRAAPQPPAAAVRAVPPPAAEGAPMAPESEQEPMFGEPNPGEPSGIALFPPMGSDPIKRGLVVPEDFELPPGYVRHYQATDDGERVPAILMFHPDYQPLDANGEPLALPADRVVPPDLAPPGLPVQMLELPEDEGVQEDGSR